MKGKVEPQSFLQVTARLFQQRNRLRLFNQQLVHNRIQILFSNRNILRLFSLSKVSKRLIHCLRINRLSFLLNRNIVERFVCGFFVHCLDLTQNTIPMYSALILSLIHI
eukprot:TRINITY_DN3055_c0_g1_i4.p1 TRINITY_DN3055_c0_g1~~TRINITY_DN3055_c0_g1_i4.p1  ORF type:complete len:109 (+),score=8.80 TRINITY_DN3055_c0_g1_i4:45-371(+)